MYLLYTRRWGERDEAANGGVANNIFILSIFFLRESSVNLIVFDKSYTVRGYITFYIILLSYPYFRKEISVLVLTSLIFSIFSPIGSIAYAAAPDVVLTYSGNSAKAGYLTISASYSESMSCVPLITIQ